MKDYPRENNKDMLEIEQKNIAQKNRIEKINAS